jgi:hypothetical protein
MRFATTPLQRYEYTGADFNVVSGSRFSASDSVTASFTLDCALAGGTGDCRSLPFADYAAAVVNCTFKASGTPDLFITCADAEPGYFLRFQTNAAGQLTGSYNMAFESSLEGGNGARITTNNTGGFTVARPGAEGRVDYTAGVWAATPHLPAPVPTLSPVALGGLAILVGAAGVRTLRRSRRLP